VPTAWGATTTVVGIAVPDPVAVGRAGAGRIGGRLPFTFGLR
jgi:hypothetical protein